MKASARNKFDRTGTYACENCGKRTRNVDGESTVGLCKACYEQCEQDNKEADGRMDDRQVADEMAKELQYGLTHLTMEPEEEEDGETDIDTNKIVPSLPPASGAAIIPADFPRFSQRDPRWASDKLGTSDSTMGGWGCVVTSNAVVTNQHGIEIDMEAAANNMMDDDLRERLHAELAPCAVQKFFDAYAKAYFEKFGEEWELNKANPVW